MAETQCSLFPIYSRLPKLDVAGSSPVSRSLRSDFMEITRIFSEPTPTFANIPRFR